MSTERTPNREGLDVTRANDYFRDLSGWGLPAMRLRRHMLICPLFDRALVEKAARSAADCVWLELEDGVHRTKKAEARDAATRVLREADWRDKIVLVRTNPMHTADGPLDVRAVASAERADGVLLAKVEDETEIRQADDLITEVHGGDNNAGPRIWCMIETAKALVNVEKIAFASPRMEGLIVGCGDLSVDLQVKRIGLGSHRILSPMEGHQAEVAYARSRVVAAGRAAGLTIIDAGFNTVRDLDAMYRHCLWIFQFGFDGMSILSPRLIPAIDRAYAPSEDDIQWALRVVKYREEADLSQKTVGIIDGELVDGPFFNSAQMIVNRVAAIRRAEEFRQNIPAAVDRLSS